MHQNVKSLKEGRMKENLLEAAEEHISSANLSLVTDPSTSNASASINIMRVIASDNWEKRDVFQEQSKLFLLKVAPGALRLRGDHNEIKLKPKRLNFCMGLLCT